MTTAAENMITIPADLVPHVRRGAHHIIGASAEALSRESDAYWSATESADPELPEGYAVAIGQLKRTLALLDAIGWSGGRSARSVTLDLAVHAAALEQAATAQFEDMREYVLPRRERFEDFVECATLELIAERADAFAGGDA